MFTLKRPIFALSFIALSLAACTPELEQEAMKSVRTQFVQIASEQCQNLLPQAEGLVGETLQQVCSCTANRVADSMSLSDLSAMVLQQNAENGLSEKINQAALACVQSGGQNANANTQNENETDNREQNEEQGENERNN
ncbi:MAG: hypothetical protein Q4E16_06615 [Neisseria sp.]|nr:hypothetical protein [Neisseria sp.]